jgi:hypothetical protein
MSDDGEGDEYDDAEDGDEEEEVDQEDGGEEDEEEKKRKVALWDQQQTFLRFKCLISPCFDRI